MNLTDLTDKAIALIVNNIEKENDVCVYLGKLQVDNGKYYFVNEEEAWNVSLDKEQLKQLKPVPDNLKEILLYADYALSLSLGSLPGLDSKGDIATGMKWHD